MKGVHHISLKARDEANFQEVLTFYTEVLGCLLVRSWGEGEGRGAMLSLGNTLLEVAANGGPELKKGRFAHIAFAVEDVSGAVERVRQAGSNVFIEPVDKSLGSDYPIRVAFCMGPAGEELEFFQER